MSEATPRFQLPFIVPGQAQKEMFHNEALVRIDAGLHAAVEAAGAETPPATPTVGESWLLGALPSGAWSGKPHQLAIFTEGGWRFLAPTVGMTAWDKGDGLMRRWTGSAWSGELTAERLAVGGLQVVGERQPAVPSPSGGTVIDAEARAAVSAVIATLMSHGLID
jgi:hypothetical protein